VHKQPTNAKKSPAKLSMVSDNKDAQELAHQVAEAQAEIKNLKEANTQVSFSGWVSGRCVLAAGSEKASLHP
jgi:hypothetical protein